ncbi:MarR family transcriptional regulator [Streptomyces sp. NPDC006527]|jgi:DNA-binding MarR family transcriptional regulator|uniref:MarR family transcriptional regulator n=1 Tax=Streptomyces sp. NPDC006527 TaxID=3364749 RepID=UPI0036B56446
MTATAPTVNGRVIGLAHYAGRAIVEHVLAGHGATFLQQITLRAVVVADGPLELDALVAEVTGALKNDPSDVRATVGELVDRGLVVSDGPLIRPTEAGRELIATTAAETGGISARIYAGIAAEDLAVAGRVLSLVTERADAELAALKSQG